MANSDSSLITKVLLLKNHFNTRSSKTVTKLIPHHAAGITTVDGMYKTFCTKSASANYGLAKGQIALYVHEKDRAWTTSNNVDNNAITFEVANSTGAPYWKVSDIDIKNLVLLMVDCAKRNGLKELTWTGDKKGSLNFHYMYKATACPGPYIKALAPWLASEVTARVQGKKSGDIVIPTVVCANGVCTLVTTTPTSSGTTDKSDKAADTVPQSASRYMYNGVDLSPVYNCKYYADKYMDLRNAFGYNDVQLFNHFCTCGMKEARQANVYFNPITYRKKYSDLDKAFGDNWIKYYAHYCTTGMKEGRNCN